MATPFPVNSSNPTPPFKEFKLYIGTNTWGRTTRQWIGNLYPSRIEENQLQEYYIKYFNTVELNPGQIRHNQAEMKKWADMAQGKDFKFSINMPTLSNIKQQPLRKTPNESEFFEPLKIFGSQTGPVCLKVDDKVPFHASEDLLHYIIGLPEDFQYFLEIANDDWSKDPKYDEFLSYLKKLDISVIIRDRPGKTTPWNLTLPSTLARYEPNGDFKRLDKCFEKIQGWQREGLKELYFFFQLTNNVDPLIALKEYKYFKKLVGKDKL